jgi:hypothetical protein
MASFQPSTYNIHPIRELSDAGGGPSPPRNSASRRSTKEVNSNLSAELEARKEGGRTASEGMLSGRREGSARAIFAWIEIRSRVYEKVSI